MCSLQLVRVFVTYVGTEMGWFSAYVLVLAVPNECSFVLCAVSFGSISA